MNWFTTLSVGVLYLLFLVINEIIANISPKVYLFNVIDTFTIKYILLITLSYNISQSLFHESKSDLMYVTICFMLSHVLTYYIFTVQVTKIR